MTKQEAYSKYIDAIRSYEYSARKGDIHAMNHMLVAVEDSFRALRQTLGTLIKVTK